MKSKNNLNNFSEIDNLLQSSLDFSSDEDKLNFEAELLHLNSMSVIESLMKEKNMNKKELSEKLDVSQSFITQLFIADKLINFKQLAKLQRIFKVNFTVNVVPWASFEAEDLDELNVCECKIFKISEQTEPGDDQNYEFQEVSLMAIGY
jgi:transcriptional regulator with XRE-family HTH domain